MFLDIRKKEPEKGDIFFVDTNVWYWTTYAASKQFYTKAPKDYQIELYPNFIEKALTNEAELYYSPLTLIELTSLIERSEFEVFKAFEGDPNYTFKRFRNNGAQRTAVIEELRTAWGQVQAMAKELPVTVEAGAAENLITIIEKYKVDGYDALYIKFMQDNKIENIITDDKDYRSIDGVHLYGCYEKP
ncbi:PIN domain-containing protein [Pseudomonas fluorescens]|uniref:type II toxin-antitoxin system VapC family toxin n=1 Tax=Pseudomonas fluorescens TaxID=294 RepID=UPI0019062ACE|nr:PIN domain-containing protein [Pseudomonas fluorescens]MBD8091691.1 PIN domain-containing protein [Pseudomonas fluorescens]MBD8716185.1 PIN domain-containing protein [Pseudomonas fluorescens]